MKQVPQIGVKHPRPNVEQILLFPLLILQGMVTDTFRLSIISHPLPKLRIHSQLLFTS